MRSHSKQLFVRLARSAFVVLAYVAMTVSLSQAQNPTRLHQCGNPKIPATAITVTDQAYVLNAAVGVLDCPTCVCDYDGDGDVDASDANKVNRVVVELDPYDPHCPVDATKCTPCTASAVKSRLANLTEIFDETWIIFACDENTPISVTDSDWGSGPVVAANGAKIVTQFGTYNRGITFQLEPACFNRCLGRCGGVLTGNTCTRDVECPAGVQCKGMKKCTGGTNPGGECETVAQCPGMGATCGGLRADIGSTPTTCTNNTPCASKGIGLCSSDPVNACPDVDADGTRFMQIAADDVTVNGLTVKGFFEGITVERASGTSPARRATIENVTLERQCDDAISHPGGNRSGVGTIVRHSTIKHGCDKCTQDEGLLSKLTSCSNWETGALSGGGALSRECWHVTYDDVLFDACETPLRLPAEGRILVKNSFIDDTSSSDPHTCQGPKLGATNAQARIDGTTVQNCKDGIILEGKMDGSGAKPKFRIENNHIVDNTFRGVLARVSASATLNRNEVRNNGTSASTPFTDLMLYGGVALDDANDPTIGEAPEMILGAAPGGVECSASTPPAGCNMICDNRGRSDAEDGGGFGGGLLQVHNSRNGYEINARNNYWKKNGGNLPANQKIGSVNNSDSLSTVPLPGIACDN